MHLISARAERAYSRSILKRLKMSQTRSSANTFQIHTKNISSDNTHLRFSSHRAHKIEEEIQIYYQKPRVHFRERTEEEQVLFARDDTSATKIFKNASDFQRREMVEQQHHRRRRRRRRSVDVENRIDFENNNNNNDTRFRNVLRKRTNRDLVCTIAHAKTFSQVLSGIQLTPTKRGGQKVKAWISNRGIGFITLDQSKSLKATAIFRRGTFERFRVGFGRGRNQEEEEDEEEEDEENEENEDDEADDGDDEEQRRGRGGGGGESTGERSDGRPRAARNNHANNGNEPPEEEEIKKYIGMSLDAFVDVLEMFANRSNGNALLGEDCAGGQTVSLSYPDRHGRVALESNSVRETTVIGGGGGSENQRGLRPLRQTTYADVATEANVFGEDEDEMNNEDDEDRDEFLRIGRALVTFVLPTTRWKEIIEDLEWANANVSLIATRDSLAFVSESSDIGSVKVDVDLSSLVEYSFREASSRGGDGGGGGGGGGGEGEGQTSNKRKQKWTYKQEFLKRSTMVPTHSGAVIATAGGTNNTFGQYRQTQTQGGGGPGGFHLPHHRVETDEAYKATTKISVGETGVLKVAHMLRLRALLGHHQSNAFGDTNATTADRNDGVGNSLRGGGGASTCNVPVTFVMAPSVVGDDHDDDGMGSDEEHEEYDAE